MLSEDDIAIDPPAEDKPVQRAAVVQGKEIEVLGSRHLLCRF